MENLEVFAREFEVLTSPAPAMPSAVKPSPGSGISGTTILICALIGFSVAYVIHRRNKDRKENE